MRRPSLTFLVICCWLWAPTAASMSSTESTLLSMVSLSIYSSFPFLFCPAEIMQASRGAVKITIISAEALSKKHLEKIQASVAGFVGAGKPVSFISSFLPDKFDFLFLPRPKWPLKWILIFWAVCRWWLEIDSWTCLLLVEFPPCHRLWRLVKQSVVQFTLLINFVAFGCFLLVFDPANLLSFFHL